MKITVEHIETGENEIIVKCKQMDSELQEVLAYLNESTKRISAHKEGEKFLLHANEIYYVEYVDNKTFIYTKDEVYETQDTLFHLETIFANMNLVRIGKSQLVNLYHIKKLKSIINSRIEITLESGDRLVVSRHYARVFKNRLGLDN